MKSSDLESIKALKEELSKLLELVRKLEELEVKWRELAFKNEVIMAERNDHLDPQLKKLKVRIRAEKEYLAKINSDLKANGAVPEGQQQKNVERQLFIEKMKKEKAAFKEKHRQNVTDWQKTNQETNTTADQERVVKLLLEPDGLSLI